MIDQFLVHSGRKLVDEGAAFIAENPDALDLFFEKSMENEGKESWRASRIIDIFCEGREGFIKPYIDQIIISLEFLNESSQRSYLRLFSRLKADDFDEDKGGILLDFCFRAMTNTRTAIAIKAISMSIIYMFGKKEPDLINELKLIVEEMADHMSPAFKGRARQLFGKGVLNI